MIYVILIETFVIGGPCVLLSRDFFHTMNLFSTWPPPPPTHPPDCCSQKRSILMRVFCAFFFAGKRHEIAQNCFTRSFPVTFVGKRAVLVFDARESKRVLTECASWRHHVMHLGRNLRKIYSNFLKLHAPPNIVAFALFGVHFCDRETQDGPISDNSLWFYFDMTLPLD